MPESEEFPHSGLHLPADDPAAQAVDALRAMASSGSVAASPELAAFLDDPTVLGSGTTPSSRSALVTVVRLPIRRAGRVAVAVGAALALAAIGGVAVAATGGTPDRAPAQVQQDDPSDTTTTTSEETETETEAPETETATAEPEETESDDSTSEETATSTHTANPVASANHHDGKGSDDEHADVNGGGVVDHHSEHPTKTHPTSGDDGADDQGDDQGDDSGDGGSSKGDSGSSKGGGGKHGG